MHVEAWEAMHTLLTAFTREKADVLDVGSYDVNGNYREMIERHAGWHYTGLDVCAGPNVDVVSADPYHFPFEDNTFDLLISGSTMEHVEAIWLWVPELVRVLKPGGMLSIVTHWSFKEHKYPIDCWRIMPDGMKYLFDQTGKLERYSIGIVSQYDIGGRAWKALDSEGGHGGPPLQEMVHRA
jgi:SAM-dependent methyltransferase